jgi:hypothetical protein
MSGILYKYEELKGEKVVKVESIRAEYGRTYDNYICFTCESGKRVLIHGGNPYDPNVDIEQMRKISFFTPEEIGEKLAKIEQRKRRREQERIDEKKRQLARLQREIEEAE